METAGVELRIVGIKTNKGWYIADAYYVENDFNWDDCKLSKYYFDGEKAVASFDKKWWFVKQAPTRVEICKSQPAINKRYELKDKTLVSDKIPMVLLQDDATEYSDEGRYWIEPYAMYESLYKYVEDKQPAKRVPINFVFETLVELQIDTIEAPPEFNYTVQKTKYVSEGTTILKNEAIQHQLIDKIITPSVLLHNKPCTLKSEQVYKILRQYIIENINPRVAKITSNYDFCFTVKKIIALSVSEERQTEILTSTGKSYKRPKYKRYWVKSRDVEVFEMTHTGSKYKGYTPIADINAANEYELKEKIDDLCTSVIEMINEPLVDCPHCKGMGVILNPIE